MRQENEQIIKYSKEQLIRGLCNTSYSKQEKRNLFLSNNGRKCQTCSKLRINKKLSPFNFLPKHRQYICFCHTQAPNQIHNVRDDNSHNNNDDNNIDSNQINQINNNNDNNIDMDEDNLENEENEMDLSGQNSHNLSSREISDSQLNLESDEGKRNNGSNEGSNHGSDGHGNNGGDGPNSINSEDYYVTRREFIREIQGINTRLDNTITRLDNMNRNIQQLLQNQNQNHN